MVGGVTRNQRAAIIGLGLLAAVILPTADGTQDFGDRRQIAGEYPLAPVLTVYSRARGRFVTRVALHGRFVTRIRAKGRVS